MNIPSSVNSGVLAALAAPGETHCVRVLCRRVNNQAPYTIRGRTRSYRATYDRALGCHILDIPLSLWQDGIGSGTYRDNLSIAHDLQGSRGSAVAPLIFLFVPWNSAGGAVQPAAPDEGAWDYLGEIETLVSSYTPPAPIAEAFGLAKSRQLDALRLYVGAILMDRAEAAKEAPLVTMAAPAPVEVSADEGKVLAELGIPSEGDFDDRSPAGPPDGSVPADASPPPDHPYPEPVATPAAPAKVKISAAERMRNLRAKRAAEKASQPPG